MLVRVGAADLVLINLALPIHCHPIISFASKYKDFGTVLEGEVFSHEFILKNAGTTAIEILGVTPG